MNNKTYKITLIAGLLISAVLSTGCYKMTSFNQAGSQTAGSLGGEAGATTQVLNFRSVAKTYSGLLGVNPSTAAANLVLNDFTSYSLDNVPGGITSPMMYNQAKLGAEFCLTLVNTERAAATRRFFNGVNFGAAPVAQISAGAFDEPINQSSRIICGHDAPASLKTELKTLLSEAVATNTVADTANAALLVCTSFLASSCTLTNN
jgi:hypothetical protein